MALGVVGGDEAPTRQPQLLGAFGEFGIEPDVAQEHTSAGRDVDEQLVIRVGDRIALGLGDAQCSKNLAPVSDEDHSIARERCDVPTATTGTRPSRASSGAADRGSMVSPTTSHSTTSSPRPFADETGEVGERVLGVAGFRQARRGVRQNLVRRRPTAEHQHVRPVLNTLAEGFEDDRHHRNGCDRQGEIRFVPARGESQYRPPPTRTRQ